MFDVHCCECDSGFEINEEELLCPKCFKKLKTCNGCDFENWYGHECDNCSRSPHLTDKYQQYTSEVPIVKKTSYPAIR